MKRIQDPGAVPGRSTKSTQIVPQRPLIISVLCAFDGPDIDIDWVKSNEMDSPAM